MALLKEKPWRYGITVSYWMIQKVVADKVANQSHVTLVPYVDKATRDANINDYIDELKIMIPSIPGYDLTFGEIYAYIHTTDSWLADSSDI